MDTVLVGAIVLMAIAVAAMAFVLYHRASSSRSVLPDLSGVKVQVDGIIQAQQSSRESLARLENALQTVEMRVVESSGGIRESLQRDLQGARSVMDSLKTAQESRRQVEDELRESTRRIEAVIAGSRSRGAAGENILAEAFRNFPSDMIEIDFRVGGKTVEFALKLVDGTRVPIDSKWPRADLLESLSREDLPDKRAELLSQLEKAVETKVKEVAKYIDSASTVPWGVVAIPDAVFSLCRCAHFNAYKSKVLLMPYGMSVPYLLSLYKLHLQFCRSVQIERLESYLAQIENGVDRLVKEVEGRMSGAITQLSNSRDDCRTAISKIRVASDSLKALPAVSQDGPDGSQAG